MAEYSYPVEEQPLPSEQWSSVTRGVGNGILDEGGFPYNLTNFSNATNTAELTAANLGDNVRRSHAILDGFYHKIDQDLVLDLPAVTSTTTYYVALQFDPIRGTEQGVPVKAGVFTSLDRTSGKNYLTLWTVRREPNQLLTDAKVTMVRPRVAGTMILAGEANLPPAESVLWGTLAVIHGGRNTDRAKIVMAINNDSAGGGDWFWKTIVDPGTWEDLPLLSNRKWAGHGFRPQIRREGLRREVRGRVSPTSGNFTPVSSGTSAWRTVDLPAGDRPSGTWGGLGQVSSFVNPGFARLEMGDDGRILAAPSKETAWIGLDGMAWYVD